MTQTFLSVVIPAYNEEERIIPTLTQVCHYLASRDYSWEVLVVDDGSADDTGPVVQEFAQGHPRVRLTHNPHRGKGYAVKTGMLAAKGEYRFLCDADLSMPIDNLSRFLAEDIRPYDVAIGSREVSGARRFREPSYRHLMGRVFNWVVQLLAVPGIKDTQCGFKCFTQAAAVTLFPLQRIEGFGFDVEILFLARLHRFRIVEVPIDWYHVEHSKVSPWRDTFRMFAEAVSVRWNHWRGRYGAIRAKKMERNV